MGVTMLGNRIIIALLLEQWKLILQGLDHSERIIKHGVMGKLEKYADLQVGDPKKVEVDADIKADINTVRKIQESREIIEKATSNGGQGFNPYLQPPNFRVKQGQNGQWTTVTRFDPMEKEEEKDDTQISINPDDVDGVPADIWYRLAGLTWGQTVEIENDEGVPISVLISQYISETSSYSYRIQNGLMRFRKHHNSPWLRIIEGKVVEED